MSDAEKEKIALKFYEMGVIKFGEFRLKSGIISPVYVDLRVLISSPAFMGEIARALGTVLRNQITSRIDIICGVPYAALPIATCLSVQESIPMIMCRKEAKAHGTKQMIEGRWNSGQNCLVVEDVITTGGSIISVVELLKQESIHVDHVLVLVDREQGGRSVLLNQCQVNLFSLFTFTELLNILYASKCITDKQFHDVRAFLTKSSNTNELPLKISSPLTLKYSMNERLNVLVQSKHSKLCVAVDITDPNQVLNLADQLGPKICALKLHLDILTLPSNISSFINGLRTLAHNHGFLIVEDRKLADIGQTVFYQLMHGIYRIAEWCDLITLHCLPGPGVFDAFRKANLHLSKTESSHCVAGLVVTEMSCKGSLTSGPYLDSCVELIKSNCDVVGGLVSQSPLPNLEIHSCGPSYWVPGIKISGDGDLLGQNYHGPAQISKRFSSTQASVIMIVGRGITESENPLQEAERYRIASINTD